MIKILTENTPIIGKDFLSEKIKYEKNLNISDCCFYNCENGILMQHGSLLTCSGKIGDFDEVLSFCRFLSINSIQTYEIIDSADCDIEYLMVKTCNDKICDLKSVKYIKKNEDIYKFSEFCASIFHGVCFDILYPYLAIRINRGACDIFYNENVYGKIISALAVLHFQNFDFITLICTAESHRNKGLCRNLIDTASFLSKSKKLCVLCTNELKNFYEKLGFTPEEKIYCYKIGAENGI